MLSDTFTVDRRPVQAWVPSPVTHGRRIRAVVFDVDGTLYRQAPLRVLIGSELALYVARHPFQGRRLTRALTAYRREQERLRRVSCCSSPVSTVRNLL